MKIIKISISFLLFLFLSSFISPRGKSNVTLKNTCTVFMGLKHYYSATIHSFGWRDDDESYSFTSLGWGDNVSSYFDATSDIVITLKLPSNHPAGRMKLEDADTHATIDCVNITTSVSVYTLTLPFPACNTAYIVELSDYSC